MSKNDPAEKVVRDIRRKTRRHHSAEEKIRIVLEGLLMSGSPLGVDKPVVFQKIQLVSWVES
jgi:hypothetical protein